MFFFLLGLSILSIMVLTLGGSVYFVDLYKFETLVGSVHFVDWGLDHWWGPSTLWIGVLTLSGVRPLCGLV